MRRLRRRGLTLIELAVVLGVIALLAALVLPAVQSAREAARRAACQNNLEQIGLGLHGHHAAAGSLPSFYNGTSLRYPLDEWDLFHMHSWRTPLLPHLGQTPLRDRVAWDAPATEPENAAVGLTAVPTFLCPSGGDPADTGWGLRHGSTEMWGVPLNEIPEADRYHVVRSDYDAMAGIQVLPDPFPTGANADDVAFVRWGVWGWPTFDTGATSGSRLLRYRPGRFADVRDGLSNTLAVVERAGKPVDLLHGEPQVTPDNPDVGYPGQVGWSASDTFLWSIHADGVGVNESNTRGPYAQHPGGANVGVADGSVRFLSESTDFDALVALYGRSDGGRPE